MDSSRSKTIVYRRQNPSPASIPELRPVAERTGVLVVKFRNTWPISEISIALSNGCSRSSVSSTIHADVRSYHKRAAGPPSSVAGREIESALARPLQRAYYRPEASQAELAASLSYGIIKGHPFFDGNKRTAFFLANEYIRAHGHPGLADGVQVGEVYKGLQTVVDQYVGVASGRLEEDALALANGGAKSKDS
ncbi:hypothetical protein PC9H_005617 [Pleurotus ostreatus]|uniref:Fido domain-containing protein n=1 Tax=Pleurotus ostreatus TaxID=5322 RepID=A0A8H6ZXF7_PLEOS|nr:uncharacterized protein PC9H_005617 [Pleurotus ostreatus]KAF7433655.1 hypothetical protein PC9H_005617 [Pleurotus ostreatus]